MEDQRGHQMSLILKMWMLEYEIRSSARGAYVLNQENISPAPRWCNIILQCITVVETAYRGQNLIVEQRVA